MHIHTLKNWQHDHDFAVIHEHGESLTLKVLILTAVTMVVEPKGLYLLGTWTAEAESVANLLPGILHSLPG